MDDTTIAMATMAWLHGDMATVIEWLEGEQYAGAASISDEQVMALMARFLDDREALLVFLPFLDRLADYWRHLPAAERHPGLERLVLSLAPLLRRDAMMIVSPQG